MAWTQPCMYVWSIYIYTCDKVSSVNRLFKHMQHGRPHRRFIQIEHLDRKVCQALVSVTKQLPLDNTHVGDIPPDNSYGRLSPTVPHGQLPRGQFQIIKVIPHTTFPTRSYPRELPRWHVAEYRTPLSNDANFPTLSCVKTLDGQLYWSIKNTKTCIQHLKSLNNRVK